MESLLSTGTAALATGLNFMTSRKDEDAAAVRSPAQPMAGFFAPIWSVIYTGLNLFATRSGDPAYQAAKPWHEVTNLLNGASALVVRKHNKNLDLAVDSAILLSAYQYTSRLPQTSRGLFDRAIRFTAQMYVGWTLAAVGLAASQLGKENSKVLGVPTQSSAKNGLLTLGAVTAAGIVLNRQKKWAGASAALAFGLGGAAIEKRNPKEVRALATAGAVLFTALTVRNLMKEEI